MMRKLTGQGGGKCIADGQSVSGAPIAKLWWIEFRAIG